MVWVTRFSWILLALALTAAAAGLFGPTGRWWGIDIGATGAAVFASTLWAGVWLFSRHPDAIFPAAWSIAERRAWAGLLFVGLLAMSFLRFMVAISHLESPPDSLSDLPSRHFGWTLFVLLIAWGVVAKALRGQETDLVEIDERDSALQYSAHRAGDWAITFAVISCVLALAYVPAEHLAWWLTPLVAANALIGLLIGRSLVEHVFLVSRYAWQRR